MRVCPSTNLKQCNQFSIDRASQPPPCSLKTCVVEMDCSRLTPLMKSEMMGSLDSSDRTCVLACARARFPERVLVRTVRVHADVHGCVYEPYGHTHPPPSPSPPLSNRLCCAMLGFSCVMLGFPSRAASVIREGQANSIIRHRQSFSARRRCERNHAQAPSACVQAAVNA